MRSFRHNNIDHKRTDYKRTPLLRINGLTPLVSFRKDKRSQYRPLPRHSFHLPTSPVAAVDRVPTVDSLMRWRKWFWSPVGYFTPPLSRPPGSLEWGLGSGSDRRSVAPGVGGAPPWRHIRRGAAQRHRPRPLQGLTCPWSWDPPETEPPKLGSPDTLI
jgi:hypothetical protein